MPHAGAPPHAPHTALEQEQRLITGTLSVTIFVVALINVVL
jgi:hypothetical protein